MPQAPFSILDVNDTWCEACVMHRNDVVGKSLSVLQGPATERISTKSVCEDVVRCKASSRCVCVCVCVCACVCVCVCMCVCVHVCV